MKLLFKIVLAAFVTIIATSCAANNSSQGAAKTEITGPAFVLFYTDN